MIETKTTTEEQTQSFKGACLLTKSAIDPQTNKLHFATKNNLQNVVINREELLTWTRFHLKPIAQSLAKKGLDDEIVSFRNGALKAVNFIRNHFNSIDVYFDPFRNITSSLLFAYKEEKEDKEWSVLYFISSKQVYDV